MGCRFEQAVATEIEKRVNLDNPDWVHPTTRNDARYEVEEAGQEPAPGVKKSRFLRKEEKNEEPLEEEITKKEVQKNSRGLTIVEFPHDPADLKPFPRPPPKNVPAYYGWTHSNEADSWFLEAHTPSIHESYEAFYDEALKKRVICPKFYSCV